MECVCASRSMQTSSGYATYFETQTFNISQAALTVALEKNQASPNFVFLLTKRNTVFLLFLRRTQAQSSVEPHLLFGKKTQKRCGESSFL